MLLLLSPAKSLDFDSKLPSNKATLPMNQAKMHQVLHQCQQLSIEQLANMMKISDKLATLNYERFQQFNLQQVNTNSIELAQSENLARQAIFAFNGDVYDGLNASQFTESELDFAQQHLRILSGLYGLLRPLDVIQPYRLEMGTALQVDDAKNLYVFWQTELTTQINALLEVENGLLNLASQEYFKVIDRTVIQKPIVDIVFLDQKTADSAYKIISFYAKKARGLMANFIIRNQINCFSELKHFHDAGYQFDPENSTETTFFFKRTFFESNRK